MAILLVISPGTVTILKVEPLVLDRLCLELGVDTVEHRQCNPCRWMYALQAVWVAIVRCLKCGYTG